ncbi:hypothetical protein CYMTET_30569, partial [Cymbomonas tetramitiformis]
LCDSSFNFCESTFKKCMKEVCSTQGKGQKDACTKQSDSFSGMTMMFGRGLFEQGQKESCQCFKNKDEATKQHKKFLFDFYSKYAPELADEAHIAHVLHTESNKASLYFNLFKNYGKQAVRFENVRDEL